jgi:hypothetical protein
MKIFIYIFLISISSIIGFSRVEATMGTQVELIARANDHDGHQLPNQSFLSNITPIINNSGDIVFQFITYENGFLERAIWYKKSTEVTGRVVFRVSGEKYLSTPSMVDNGDFVFNLYSSSAPLGVYKYASMSTTVNLLIDPEDHSYRQYSNVTLGEDGNVIFRGSSFSGKQSLVKFSNSFGMKKLFKVGNGASFLFGPNFNKNNLIVSKVRMGELGEWDESMPDEILVWDLSGNKKVIAKDRDSDPNSIFLGFFNSVGVSSSGKIVFIARLEHKKSGLFIASKLGHITQVAIEGQGPLAKIEQFAPHINRQGLVAFRGIDTNGKRQIFTVKNGQITANIGEDDVVTTDRETGRILFRDGYPGFGGGISINDKSQVLFNCLITGKNRESSLGSGIYLLQK